MLRVELEIMYIKWSGKLCLLRPKGQERTGRAKRCMEVKKTQRTREWKDQSLQRSQEA